MSIQFNDLVNYKGLVQLYEKECGYNRGDVSGDDDLLKEYAADVNICLDDFMVIALRSSGTWQVDDSNFTDYPIITTNLVSGQRDYPFTTDETGNLILDIYRVYAKGTDGVYRELNPLDQQVKNADSYFSNGLNTAGVPTAYDKTANALFLREVPNYNSSAGLKMLINREGSYFSYDATTKKPGVPGIFHSYFYLKPALMKARRSNLGNYALLERAVIELEGSESMGIIGKIQKYYGQRTKDERPGMKALIENTR